MIQNNNEFLTPDMAADDLHVSPKTIRRWCLQGKMRYYKFGRSVRIRRTDYIKFLQENFV